MYYVYALLDSLGCEVYIGHTVNPHGRLLAHHTCISNKRMGEAVLSGCKFTMEILSEHEDLIAAKEEELEQIWQRRDTGILNVAGRNGEHGGLRARSLTQRVK